MTWFKVDDSLAFHHKVVGVENAAMGLWVRAGAWCAQQNNDGVVPAHMVKALGATRRHAIALVAFGLWEDQGDATYVFHDWHLYQPTSAEVKAERLAKSQKKAEAGRSGGIASGVSRRANKEAKGKQEGSNAEANAEANGKQNEAPTRPDPLPKTSSSAAASSLTEIDSSAGAVVKAYCDGASSTSRPVPSGRFRGKVGKDANRLNSEGHAWSDLAAAAFRMGASGWDDLDRELQKPQRGKPVSNGVASHPDEAYSQGGIFSRSSA